MPQVGENWKNIFVPRCNFEFPSYFGTTEIPPRRFHSNIARVDRVLFPNKTDHFYSTRNDKFNITERKKRPYEEVWIMIFIILYANENSFTCFIRDAVEKFLDFCREIFNYVKCTNIFIIFFCKRNLFRNAE